MNNVNDSFFHGYYKDIWRRIIPEVLTQRELDFIMKYFQLQAGDRVLDLMCGYGRHALGLAEQGVEVTAIDNLPEYTGEIRTLAAARDLPVAVITDSVLAASPAGKYDLAICMGNSLNFFPPSELNLLLDRISGWLKPGGHFLINSWSLTEIAIPAFREHSEQRVDDYRFITESKILEDPHRIETTTTIIPAGGEAETSKAVDYLYTLDELASALGAAGLKQVEVFSIPGKKQFAPGEPRAYIVTRRS